MASVSCCDLAVHSTNHGSTISDRQKRSLGQGLVFSFAGPVVPPIARTLISEYYAGSVLLKSSNFQDHTQISQLTQELQQLAKNAGHSQPLLIGVQHEGGLATGFLNGFRLTRFPSPLGVAAGNDVALTSMVGEAISKEVSTIGINWLFAPVLEVVTDVTEPLDVSSRFSDTLEVVKDHARAIVQGFHNNHVALCAMETFTMSIQDIYTSMNFEERGDNTVGRTDHEELDPLRHLIEERCLDSIQLSSSVYQFHDQIRLGQSIREAVQMILRERLGCQSPVVVNCSAFPPESNACVVHAPLRALLAGCDMIRLSNNVTTLIASIRAMHSAIQSSDLSDVNASAAASRIWNFKKNFTSWDSIFDSCGNASIDFSQHANFAQSAYRASITALTPEPSPLLGFSSSSILLLLTPTVYVGTTSTFDPFEPLGRAISRSHSRIRHVPYTMSAGLTSTHMAFLSRALAVVLVLCNSSSAFTEVQNEFFNAVRNVVHQRESVADGEGLIKIVIGAGDPRDLKGAWSDWWSVCCYDFSRGALEAVAEVIVGEKIASGQLPLHLN